MPESLDATTSTSANSPRRVPSIIVTPPSPPGGSARARRRSDTQYTRSPAFGSPKLKRATGGQEDRLRAPERLEGFRARVFLFRSCRSFLAFSSSRLRDADRLLPARLMWNWIIRTPEPAPFGLTDGRAMVRAIVAASLVKRSFGGLVETVFTFPLHFLLGVAIAASPASPVLDLRSRATTEPAGAGHAPRRRWSARSLCTRGPRRETVSACAHTPPRRLPPRSPRTSSDPRPERRRRSVPARDVATPRWLPAWSSPWRDRRPPG